jgi:hypothetical protein
VFFPRRAKQHTAIKIGAVKKSPIENEAGIKRFWLHFLEKE